VTAGGLATFRVVGVSLACTFDELSDEAAALGSGMIASTVSRTAEAYFQ
jgi:hypothetical protein